MSESVTSVVQKANELMNVFSNQIAAINTRIDEAENQFSSFIETSNQTYAGIPNIPKKVITVEDGENLKRRLDEALKIHNFVEVFIPKNTKCFLDDVVSIKPGHSVVFKGEDKDTSIFESKRSVMVTYQNYDLGHDFRHIATLFIYPGSCLKFDNVDVFQTYNGGHRAPYHQGVVCVVEYNFGAAASSISVKNCNLQLYSSFISLQGLTEHIVNISLTDSHVKGSSHTGWFSNDDDAEPVGFLGVGSWSYQQCRFSFVSSGNIFGDDGLTVFRVINSMTGKDETDKVAAGNFSKDQFMAIA